MPKGPSLTPEQIQAEISRFRDMGGAFTTLANETTTALEDMETISATLKEMKTKVKLNMRRLSKAEKSLEVK